MRKICSKCNNEKYFSEYHRNKRARDGLLSCCKICANITNKKSKIKNKANVIAYNKKYRRENIEKRRIYNQKYLKEHPLSQEKKIERAVKFKNNHPNYYKNNIKRKEYSRLYRIRHPDKRKLSQRKFDKKAVAELRDCYVKELIVRNTALLHEDIPQSMVSLFRYNLIAKRLIGKGKGIRNGKH
jgi:hypothetical protein